MKNGGDVQILNEQEEGGDVEEAGLPQQKQRKIVTLQGWFGGLLGYLNYAYIYLVQGKWEEFVVDLKPTHLVVERWRFICLHNL